MILTQVGHSSREFLKSICHEPHNYILDGICLVMDGYNLLATTPARSGKGGYFTLLMLIVHDIAADTTLMIRDRKFPKYPIMIVVLPTKALEEDMVCALI
jgi:hypothetical protein